MAIFLTKDSKVIVQGMTGSEGMKHTTRMIASGTAIVGGVNPRKAGTTVDFPGGQQVPPVRSGGRGAHPEQRSRRGWACEPMGGRRRRASLP